MKVLVTGGAGFIGSHLVEALLERDPQIEVTVIDDLSSPVRWVHSDSDRVRYVSGDVRQWEVGQWAARYGTFDAAYSLASPVSVESFLRDPTKTIETNVASARLCCEAAPVSVFLSSCDAYGQRYDERLVEEMPSIFRSQLPRFCYGIAKLAGEAVVADYRRQGQKAYAVRLFKTFGPRMGLDGRLASVFISNAVQGLPLMVFDGSQVIAPCYVEDTVRGLLTFLERPAVDFPINIGQPDFLTVAEFAKEVIAATASRSEIITIDMPADRPNDPPRRVPDISAAKRLLGWRPEILLKEAIHLTAQYYNPSASLPIR